MRPVAGSLTMHLKLCCRLTGDTGSTASDAAAADTGITEPAGHVVSKPAPTTAAGQPVVQNGS